MQRKNLFRQHCFKRLQKTAQRSYGIDYSILNTLYHEIGNAKTVMLYIPLEIEVNTVPLIEILRREKRIVYVPFMEGKSFRLVKYRLPLEVKKFGIKEPKFSKEYIKNIDVAIVPIVATDSTLRRVGFGKGMYDRFFEKNRKKIKKTIFVVRTLCYSQEIITHDHDIRADVLISKEGIIRIQ
ncbi:MAG: 5-formyltetrahydrofolate cyclo-ligase [Campylobacterales bacterium]|nr:5-formyltetrahydrofolate cyclo-ligase [Campylobacterales bacterium]